MYKEINLRMLNFVSDSWLASIYNSWTKKIFTLSFATHYRSQEVIFVKATLHCVL
jgi:hypothetical protein